MTSCLDTFESYKFFYDEIDKEVIDILYKQEDGERCPSDFASTLSNIVNIV